MLIVHKEGFREEVLARLIGRGFNMEYNIDNVRYLSQWIE